MKEWPEWKQPIIQGVYPDLKRWDGYCIPVKLPDQEIKPSKPKRQRKTMKLRFLRWSGPVKVYEVLVRKWFFFWVPLNKKNR